MTLSAGRRLIWLLLALPGSIGACQRDEVPPQKASQQRAPKKKPRPALLYLPEGGDIAPPPAAPRPRQPVPQPQPMGRCPADMVDIAGRFCIDRYESTLVDGSSGHVFSPYYSPSPQAARQAYQKWSGRGRPPGLFALDVPVLPDWQLEPDLVPLAVSKPGVIPQGYMSGAQAAAACAAANKRLCTAEEWELACRGQRGSKFPYGDHYESGACNVCRPAHPALILHGDASVGHRDPRLNMVEHQGERLLRPTGFTPRCKSVWGNDGVYDMVGNLDEWLDDPDGLFAGGFFSRGTKAGCQARVSVHPPQYFDYSLGVRCCR